MGGKRLGKMSKGKRDERDGGMRRGGGGGN